MLTTKNILALRLLVVAGLAIVNCFGSVHAQDAKADQQKALRKRQCEFFGKVATKRGQCVDKSQVDAMNTKDRAEGTRGAVAHRQQRGWSIVSLTMREPPTPSSLRWLINRSA